jgi:geranylgeranyl diphosphate synthase type II
LRPLLRAREKLGTLIALRLLEELDRMAEETAEGQAMELGWRRDNVLAISERDYLQMVLKKTCWLTIILPIRMGALIGTRDGIDLDRFIRFGFFLGAAFQIQDDLLNLVGDHARYGKEMAGDLWEGKRTLMVIRLLEQSSDAEREEIHGFLGRSRAERSVASVERVRRLMDRHGCIEHARALAHGLAGAAQHELELLSSELFDGEDKSFLAALPTWVLERT